MAGEKRKSSEDSTARKVKIEQPGEFSIAVQKKLQTSRRTGQACDRCKVRKIKCDGLLGGCSPCLQNRTECCTTDRITGRATSRGYVEDLEQQNRDLQAKVEELEQALSQTHMGKRPSIAKDQIAKPRTQVPSAGTPPWQSGNGSPASDGAKPQAHSTSMLRSAATGDRFLGVTSSNPGVSAIRGTSLSLLGMEIDIADFVSPDSDEPDQATFHPALYTKSYQAFFQSVLNVNTRLDKLELPPRDEGFTYADWFFRALNPYLPLLHRPTTMHVLTRMYDDPAYVAPAADTVIIHTLFAFILSQYATRNYEDAAAQDRLNKRSNLHYHYALSVFHLLVQSRTEHDVQAMTMLCVHLRAFPKPCASWIMLQFTMSFALELNMHRSEEQLQLDLDPLQTEMRKRTFYTLVSVHVTIAGKLGKPMALRIEDFDIEMPNAVDDEALSSHGLDTSRAANCQHLYGLEAYAIAVLFLEMYTDIYAVRRRPESHIASILKLESKLQSWKDDLPRDFSGSDHSDHSIRLFTWYSQMWELEMRLLLRHPSVSTTTDETFNSESMRICLDVAKQMLLLLDQIRKYKCLDTTWYNAAVYVTAITITLFSNWQKRETMTAADLAALRTEMNQWLEVVGEIGLFLGSGNRLRDAIRVVIDGTLSIILQDSRAQVHLQNTNQKSHEQGNRTLTLGSSTNSSAHSARHSSLKPVEHAVIPEHTTTHSNGARGRTWHGRPGDPQIRTPHTISTTGSVTGITSPESRYWKQAQQPSEQANLPNFNNAMLQPGMEAWQSHEHPSATSQAWQQWTSAMTGHLDTQESYSAEALLQLGNRYVGPGEGVQMPDDSGATWPLNIFDIESGNLLGKRL